MRTTRQQARGTGSASSPGAGRAPWLFGAAAAALAVFVYLAALHNPFVYDDHDTVVANPSLAALSNIRFVLVYSPFRPVVNTSYAIDRALWGLSPFGFHLTNILLHAGVVALLYAWLWVLLQDRRARSAEAAVRPSALRAQDIGAAFAGAAIFAVHPLTSEAVAYVSGRSELLCAGWFLAGLLLARRAIVRRSIAAGLASAITAALAVASKEVGVAFPVVLLAYDWLLRPGAPSVRLTPDTTADDEARRRRRLVRVFGPVFVVAAAAAAYRFIALQDAGRALAGSLLLNGLTEAIVIWRYVALLVWPAHQSIMHAVHVVTSAADPLALAAVGGLIAAIVVAWRVRTVEPMAAFGVIWCVAVIAPSSSVVALREGMTEHRAYFASAGEMVLVASGVARLLAARAPARRPGRAYVAVLVAALVACSALTRSRIRVWSDPVTLWREATVEAAGMWEPHYALADALRERGECASAVPEYEFVVRMRPSHGDAQTNLGICLAQTGRLGEAETAFRRVVEMDPGSPRGYTNLAALALVAGDPPRARDWYLEAITHDPRNVLARMQLARLYEGTFHDHHAAARMCGEARAIAPFTPDVVECVQRNRKLAAEKDAGR